MTDIGRVESLWRYPVKSMRGEEMAEAFVGYSGVYGDRLYAFKSAAGEKGFPYLTGREQARMLLFTPRFKHPARATKPEFLAEAESESPGLNPCFDDPANLAMEVVTPDGETLEIGDPRLAEALNRGSEEARELSLLRSERALTDCRPVSLISSQTIRQLGAEIGEAVDPRRFRANLYLDLVDARGFAEDDLVGRTLRIGPKVRITIVERDPRCRMITIDPETAETDLRVLQKVGREHGGMAGIYGAVLAEGLVSSGDRVELLG
ncbi:MAG: MOSC domain-containing protein [Kiloniellales bacterium]|nr:MOSC domain-containing protein [Kiloniellales bacterium]